MHRLVQQAGFKRQKAHALMMGHIGADNRVILSTGQTCLRIVDCLEQAVLSGKSLLFQFDQVVAGHVGFDHDGKHGRVRGDNQIVGQTTF